MLLFCSSKGWFSHSFCFVEMRLHWCIVLFSVVSLAHSSEIKEDQEKNIEDNVGLCIRISTTKIDYSSL